jgi:hypothetical protein
VSSQEVVTTYNPYEDPSCPACDCADWGMMFCGSNCSREKYIQRKKEELRNAQEGDKNNEAGI